MFGNYNTPKLRVSSDEDHHAEASLDGHRHSSCAVRTRKTASIEEYI